MLTLLLSRMVFEYLTNTDKVIFFLTEVNCGAVY